MTCAANGLSTLVQVVFGSDYFVHASLKQALGGQSTCGYYLRTVESKYKHMVLSALVDST